MWPWLIGLGQWLIKLVGGWLPIGTKPVSEWLGKVLWAVGIFVACMFVWNKLSAPSSVLKPSTHADRDSYSAYHQESPKATFGCANVRIIEYYKEMKNATN